jgi:hypothetical protein
MAPATAAPAKPAATAVAQHSQHAAAPQNFEAYYDYSTANGPYATTSPDDVPCLELVVTANWGNYGCRNVDESFGNLLSVAVRLYYSPDEQGAWVCIPAGWISPKNSGLSGYYFNNGPNAPGYEQYIWNNVASASVSSANNCVNSITKE